MVLRALCELSDADLTRPYREYQPLDERTGPLTSDDPVVRYVIGTIEDHVEEHLRSIRPLDTATVVESVRKTGRLITVHEAWVTAGLGAEVVAAVAETCPEALRAPVARVGTAPVPTPSGKVRPHALPNASTITNAVRRLLTYAGDNPSPPA